MKKILFHIHPKKNHTGAWQKTKPKNKSFSVYEGQTEKDLPHGKGIYSKTDGSSYIGHFKNRLIHGHGIFTWNKNAP